MRHADQVLAVVNEQSSAARSTVAASWLRSLTQYGLDPERLEAPEQVDAWRLKEAEERMGRLLKAAQPSLDRLFEAVGQSGCCVLLTDKDGVPLDRRGHPGDDADFRAAGLWTGMVWHEAREGTNGVGTVIAEQRALTIHQDQHFFTRHTQLSCTAAPLFDHDGELAGVLDVSGVRGQLDWSAVALIDAAVREAARRIETANFRAAYLGARIVLTPEADANALLAIDRDDMVIGATRAARRLHGITSHQVKSGLPASAILSVDAQEEDLAAAERGVILRSLARHAGNVSAAATALGMSRATLHRKLRRLGLNTGK
jgi:transcriptional regulator of acetoin/glycerol metabolism